MPGILAQPPDRINDNFTLRIDGFFIRSGQFAFIMGRTVHYHELNPMTLNITLIAILSYVIGAIPVAVLIARINSVNIFEVGSGNMGTTNVIRAVGPRMGVLVLILDMVKGMGAIWMARAILNTNPDMATVIAAIFSIIGHNWSIFARIVTGRLRGGKGAATALGTFLLIAPWYLTAIVVVVGVSFLARTRYMSLAVLMMLTVASPSLIVMALVPALPLNPVHLIYTFTLTALILYRFRENIQRLLAGNERRVGERAK
jgi:glycerol-3-phosphate acyltransferase PlsY